MNMKSKKPWVKPELRPLEPTRQLLNLFGRDARMAMASIDQKK